MRPRGDAGASGSALEGLHEHVVGDPALGGLEHRPLPSDDPRQRRPDITLARDRLGWEPDVDLRAGLELTIPYFAGQLASLR